MALGERVRAVDHLQRRVTELSAQVETSTSAAQQVAAERDRVAARLRAEAAEKRQAEAERAKAQTVIERRDADLNRLQTLLEAHSIDTKIGAQIEARLRKDLEAEQRVAKGAAASARVTARKLQATIASAAVLKAETEAQTHENVALMQAIGKITRGACVRPPPTKGLIFVFCFFEFPLRG